ncbi:hypothetical protein AB672_03240 [Xylella taiwanensis]|nr:hypothetical protein AB672_03240 [Xylella taiwanensis]
MAAFYSLFPQVYLPLKLFRLFHLLRSALIRRLGGFLLNLMDPVQAFWDIILENSSYKSFLCDV